MIELTEKAQNELKKLVPEKIKQDENITGFRISVTGGGCAGYTYGMTFDTEKPGDLIQDVGGLNIYVNSESIELLSGLTIDYMDTLGQQGFSIQNPQAKSSCGCGKSFSA